MRCSLVGERCVLRHNSRLQPRGEVMGSEAWSRKSRHSHSQEQKEVFTSAYCSTIFPLLLYSWGPQTRELCMPYTFRLALATSAKAVMTSQHKHAHRAPSSRQSLIETFFPGDPTCGELTIEVSCHKCLFVVDNNKEPSNLGTMIPFSISLLPRPPTVKQGWLLSASLHSQPTCTVSPLPRLQKPTRSAQQDSLSEQNLLINHSDKEFSMSFRLICKKKKRERPLKFWLVCYYCWLESEHMEISRLNFSKSACIMGTWGWKRTIMIYEHMDSFGSALPWWGVIHQPWQPFKLHVKTHQSSAGRDTQNNGLLPTFLLILKLLILFPGITNTLNFFI